MKAEELMIGDWLIPYNETEPRRVEHLTYQYDMSGKYDVVAFEKNPYTFNYTGFCKPVPITREILEKNGFRKVQHLYCLLSENKVYPEKFFIEYNPNNYCLFINDGMMPAPIVYVHQLQHVLRLCGIEKEIDL